MTRRRPSNVLKDQLSKPSVELGWFTRTGLWAFRSETSGVLTIAILFALSYGVPYVIPSDAGDVRTAVLSLFGFLILGVFLGIIVVTEEEKSYRASGWRVRMISGALAFAALTLMGPASLEVVAIAALFGAVLGYFGIYWVKWI